MLTIKTLRNGVSCAALLALALLKTQAQTEAIWTGASGGEWNTGSDWSTGFAPADPTTNALIGAGITVNYNLPMVATSFGVLTNNGILNVNTNGFNNSQIVMNYPGGAPRLFVNTGGVLNVTGNLGFCSNSVVTMARGSSVTVSGTLVIGSDILGGTTGTGTVGAYGSMTNFGGNLTCAAVSLNPRNESLGTGANCRLVILGGTNNLGAYSAARSPGANSAPSALGSDGLVISNGIVTTTSISIGNNAHGVMYVVGGIVTNTGTLTLKNSTATRPARFVQAGGLFVDPDPNLVQMNLSSTADTVYTVLGGTNIVGGFQFYGADVYFTNAGNMYVGSQGIVSNGTPVVFASLNNGGLFGATAPWTNSVTMNLSSGTFTFQTADPSGTPNNITLNNPLTGPGKLNVTGGGTLTLEAANTYVGNTVINGGTLALGTSGTLASPNILVGSGTVFDVSQIGAGYTLNAGQTISGFGTVTGAVTVASTATIYPGSNVLTGTLTINTGLTENGGAVNEFYLSSNPSGPGNDLLNVPGSLTLSGTNTILINGSVTSGGAYPLIQYGALTGDVTNFTVSGASGVISNSTVNKILYFVAQTSLRSPTNITWLGNLVNSNWDTELSTNWLDQGGSAPDFFISGDNTRFTNLGASNSLVNIVGTVAPGSITINTTSNYTFSGTGLIGGVGSLTVSNGTLTILTTNTYSGPTILDGGVLATPLIANSSSPSGIGAASSDPGNLVFNGGTLSFFGTSAGTDHGITLTNGGGIFDVSNSATLTLNGVLNGPGGLTEIDSGTLVLANANTYTGNTTISNGTLNLNNVGGAGAGTIVFAGGTVSLTVGSQQTYANNLTVTANSTLNSAGGNNNILAGTWTGNTNTTLNVLISTAGTFSINGSMTNFLGTVELGNDGGYFRFNAGGGNTQFGAPNSTIDAGSNNAVVEARNPGTIAIGTLEGGTSTYLKGPSSTAGMLVWQIGSNTNNPSSIYYGTIADNAGNENSSLLKVGSGTLALAGQNTYSGPTTVSSGVLALTNNPNTGSDGALELTTNINILAGAILDVSGLINNSSTLQLGEFTGNQMLQGSGTINGALNVDSLVAPGNGISGSTGTLTVTNAINLYGTAWMKLNRGSSPNSDRLVSSYSTITYGGTLVVTNVGAPLQAGDTFTLFSGSGLGAGSFSTIVLPDYYTFNTGNLGVNGSVTVTGSFKPSLNSVNYSQIANGYLTLNASNGVPNGAYAILTTTNVALPMSQWTSIATGNFDGGGNINGLYVTVNPALPQSYFVLQGF